MNAHIDQLGKEPDPHLTLEEKRAQLGIGFRIRQWIVTWLTQDTHMTDVYFGENTISLSTVTDVIRFSLSGTPAQEGDLSMDLTATSGRPTWHDGTTVRSGVHTVEAIVEGGTNAFTADQSMGSNKLTSLADGTGANDAVNKGQLDAAVSGLSWQEPVSAKDYLGTRTITEINSLTPSAGQTVVAGDAGTPSAGSSSALVAGSVAEYDGANWIEIVAGSGGFVPIGTRLLIHDETVTLFSPLSDGVDESAMADFDGTSLTPSAKTAPADGYALLVKGELSVNENTQWVHDTSPSVLWLQFGGTSTAHSSLTGLTTGDDHTQYAILAGRSGGQTLFGSDTGGEDLTLDSNSTGSKGDIIVANTDTDFVPSGDGASQLGRSDLRWGAIFGSVITSGDHVFSDPKNGWHYRVKEGPAGLVMFNEKTGEFMGEIALRRPGIVSSVLNALGL